MDRKLEAVEVLNEAVPIVPSRSGKHGKSLATRIREKTDDLEAQIQRMIDISLGKHGAGVNHQILAAQWLADRAHGKAVDISATLGDVSSAATEALSALRSEDLAHLVQLAKERKSA